MEGEELEPVQVLAQKGIKKVPPCFVQPLQHRPGFRSSQSTLQIPTIDLYPLSAGHSHPSFQSELSKLAQACEQWGFFQIVNHGVGEEVMKEMKRVVRGFFEMPWEVKRRWGMRDGGHVGYAARSSAADKDTSDWVDLLAHYLAPDSLKLAGLHQTPTLPLDYREVTTTYGEVMKELLSKLCSFICETLGLPRDYIEEICGECTILLRNNCYPSCPEPEQVLGVSSHSDGGVLTVLLEDGGYGLEVKKDNEWILVKTHPNALIVNIGDMLQVISNGKYESVEHRAIVSNLSERYSIVTFLMAPLSNEVFIEPATPLLHRNGEQPRYRGTTMLDYLKKFFEKDKAFGKSRVDAFLLKE